MKSALTPTLLSGSSVEHNQFPDCIKSTSRTPPPLIIRCQQCKLKPGKGRLLLKKLPSLFLRDGISGTPLKLVGLPASNLD